MGLCRREIFLPKFGQPLAGKASRQNSRVGRASSPDIPLDGRNRGKNGKAKSGEDARPTREVTKWDIFYYVYGLLHHPEYRTKYAANLRRELPRIPILSDFWAISDCGKQLADLHVNFEQAAEYPLVEKWSDDGGLNFRVEKMKLMKDKSAIIYNKDLTLTGIPAEAFDYRLGNRSAIDWIIDQYQISTDKRSGIVNDPNQEDDTAYIIGLLKKVVTVSLETVRIVGEIAETSLGQ
jgi:predicted helicase